MGMEWNQVRAHSAMDNAASSWLYHAQHAASRLAAAKVGKSAAKCSQKGQIIHMRQSPSASLFVQNQNTGYLERTDIDRPTVPVLLTN